MFKSVKKRNMIGLVLILALLAMSLSGCGTKSASTNSQAPASTAKTRTLVDDAGRTVTIPVNIKKAFSTSPVGTDLLYTLDPTKLIGWNYALTPLEKEYTLQAYQSLPNLGGWYATATCDTEEVLRLHPDIIIDCGTINATEISRDNNIQEQLKIPVFLINDATPRDLAHTYRVMGTIFGEKTRADMLANYCNKTVNEVSQKAKTIPANQRITVYYAEGPKGVTTDPSGSPHSELLNLVGGVNVAKVPLITGTGGMGESPVSPEQILQWNPDVIITWSKAMGGAYATILSGADWRTLKAVKDHHVYQIPDGPFSWFDRPPSVNQILGLRWLANLLYPDVYKYNIKSDAKYFYSTFYHYNLSDQQLNALLAGAERKGSN